MSHNSYYYERLIPAFMKAGVLDTDSLNIVKIKLGDPDMLHDLDISPVEHNALNNFATNCWDKEKLVVPNIQDLLTRFGNGEEGAYPDPMLDPHTSKNIEHVERAEPPCTRCRGRRFKEFNFCPFCGLESEQLGNESALNLRDIPGFDPDFGPISEPPKSCGQVSEIPWGSQNERPNIMASVAFKDAEITVTDSEIEQAKKELDKFKP